MNLYLSLGRVWTGTQAGAKATQGGKDFESIEVPTDKPGLLAFLNAYMVRFGGAAAAIAPPDLDLEAVAAAMPGMALTLPNTATFAAPAPAIVSPTPANPGDCTACNRSQRVAKMVTNSIAALNIMADLEDVTDAASLGRIIALAESRKAAL